MKEIKYTCDICKKEIPKGNFWTRPIKIYEYEVWIEQDVRELKKDLIFNCCKKCYKNKIMKYLKGLLSE